MFTNSFAGDNFWPASIDLDVSQLDMNSDDEWTSIDIYSKLDPAPGGLINDFIIQDAKIAVESDFPNKAPPKEVPHEFQPAVEDVGFLHLDDFELTFTDETAVSIRGVVKHYFGSYGILGADGRADAVPERHVLEFRGAVRGVQRPSRGVQGLRVRRLHR